MIVRVLIALAACTHEVSGDCAYLSGGALQQCEDRERARSALGALGDCAEKPASEREACQAERDRLQAEISGLGAPADAPPAQTEAAPPPVGEPAAEPTAAPPPPPASPPKPKPTFAERGLLGTSPRKGEDAMEAEDVDE